MSGVGGRLRKGPTPTPACQLTWAGETAIKGAHLGAAAVTRLMQVLAGWTPLERNETIASRES